MKKIVFVVGIGVLAVAGCSSGANTATPAAAVATATPTPASTSAAPAPKPKATTPAPAKTVYVTPAPEKTVYVVPAPAPAPATTVYVAPPPQPGTDSCGYVVQCGVGTNSYPINSNGAIINVRSGPSTYSAIIGTVSQNQYVHLTCTTYGDAVSGPFGTTSLWDHIDSPFYGYVSDQWVNTSTGAPVVGSC